MKIKYPLILASTSPRRRDLLSSLDIPFTVLAPSADETPYPHEKPQDFAERLAAEKAASIQQEGLILGADTIVTQEGSLLGKPEDAEHAREMLTRLSDSEHEVVTGVCLMLHRRKTLFSVTTKVFFRSLSAEEIDEYIQTGEPMDKAGSYAIQGGAAHMIRSIHGSYTNVVGLPMCEVYEAIRAF